MKLFGALRKDALRDITFNFIPVKTGLSLEKKDVRNRAINLYKAWYRQIPIVFYDYNIPLTVEEGRSKLREIFVKNSRITDPRVADQLIIKGQIELNESVNKQKEECHLWKYFRTTDQRGKSQDFLSKFIDGR